ncbi:MAG: hypothetical protein C3F11_09445 [Methylocystaceae bacterium]|nr:MAG: hypothetical protein C3F11_09445 [Methylocystaceae bacterium]
MARLQCRSCGFDGEIEWDGQFVCPSCGSTNTRAAIATAELSDAEIEMIANSEIPEEFRWNSDDLDDGGDR